MPTTENNSDTDEKKTKTNTGAINTDKKNLTKPTKMIEEFLTKAENIAMSTTSVEIDFNDLQFKDASIDTKKNEDHLHSLLPNDEALVQEVIANDNRLRKEIEEFLEVKSLSENDGEEHSDDIIHMQTRRP